MTSTAEHRRVVVENSRRLVAPYEMDFGSPFAPGLSGSIEQGWPFLFDPAGCFNIGEG
jgi:hypothetical protein